MKKDLVIIGAGPAGLAAAVAAKKAGVENIVIVERDIEAGGILNQCIHSGFGLRYFGEELTGPEYAERFVKLAKEAGVEFLLDTMALTVSSNLVKTLNTIDGLIDIECKAVILAMGCRERTRFSIAIPGTRPSGVMTAGLAQRYINIEGKVVGKRVVILGSGDIGLIMARRLTLEGAQVLACIELLPYSSGLTRNISQCLDDFNIPLLLSHTVTEIHGKDRITGVTVCEVDESRRPIEETKQYIECDTLLLSVGLIPENELSSEAGVAIDSKTRGPVVDENNETSIEGIFACGNVLQVHDLVDYVSEEAERTGRSAAEYILGENNIKSQVITTVTGENVSYVLPQRITSSIGGKVDIYFRVKQPITEGEIIVYCGETEILRKKKKYMAPGEMEILKIEKQLITDILEVKVEVIA